MPRIRTIALGSVGVATLAVMVAAWNTPSAQVPPVRVSAIDCPNDGDDKCKIEVLVKLTKKNRCAFKNANAADAVNVNLTGTKHNVRMVWILKTDQADKEFRFCPGSGDGAFLKEVEDDGQFGEMGTTETNNGNADPNPTMACKPRFRWKNANTNTETYDYMLRFREMKSGVVCEFDPWIRNG